MSSRYGSPLQSVTNAVTALFFLRRSRRLIVFAGVFSLLLLGALFHRSGGLQNTALRRTLWSILPDVLSIQFTRTLQRPAARIPRLVMSPSLAGLDPAYVEHELARDMELHGGYNYTPDYRSHLPPASAFSNIRVAHPDQDVLKLEPQYRGLKCIDRYPLDHCAFPGVCPPANADPPGEKPCAVWETGYSASLERFIAAGGMNRPSTARKEVYDWDRPGRWIGDMWVPYGSVKAPEQPYHFFTPEEAHQCFIGKRVMFQGDSMVRQLFSRVVQYLRLQPTNCEHVFSWSSASYQTFPNGTDKFNPDCPNRKCTYPEDALYTIQYEWHNQQNETENVARMVENKIDIVVHGLVYWVEWQIDLVDSRETFNKFLEENNWHGLLTWFTTPQHNSQSPWLYDERNKKMRDLFHGWRQKGRSNVGILPVDRLVRLHNGRQHVRDRQPIDSLWIDVHYMCDYDNIRLDEPIKPGLQNLKAPMNWDARDMVNFNHMQVWLNSVCDPRASS